MSAPLAAAPRTKIDHVSCDDFVTLGRALGDCELAELVFCTSVNGRPEELVGFELDRAGLAKLRDACNALLATSEAPPTVRHTLRIRLDTRTAERLVFDANGQTKWVPISAVVEWGPASRGDMITIEADLPT